MALPHCTGSQAPAWKPRRRSSCFVHVVRSYHSSRAQAHPRCRTLASGALVSPHGVLPSPSTGEASGVTVKRGVKRGPPPHPRLFSRGGEKGERLRVWRGGSSCVSRRQKVPEATRDRLLCPLGPNRLRCQVGAEAVGQFPGKVLPSSAEVLSALRTPARDLQGHATKVTQAEQRRPGRFPQRHQEFKEARHAVRDGRC